MQLNTYYIENKAQANLASLCLYKNYHRKLFIEKISNSLFTYNNIPIKVIAETICNNAINNPYRDTDFPCLIKSFTLTLNPIAAKAIILNLLLISLQRTETSVFIIFKENNAQVIKNPITYHGIFIFPFSISCTSSYIISLFDLCFK